MLRRLIFSALALCALLALAGCGANRLMGPVVNTERARAGLAGIGDRDGDPTGGGGAIDPQGLPAGAASDTLYWAGDRDR